VHRRSQHHYLVYSFSLPRLPTKTTLNVGKMHAKEKKPAMVEQELSVGQFVRSIIVAGRQRVAKTRNAAGYATIYPEVASELVETYPGLTVEQKQIVSEGFKQDAEATKVRTGVDVAAGIGAASRILSRGSSPKPALEHR
jgi:hypothetical protein